ncbi:MAG: glycine--tRNA ligase subunit beta, partial [Reyranellaceae bacterium]
MSELLLELLSEEIPARMQARAADDLKRLVTDGLKVAGLSFSKAEAFATPRRLALVVDGLPTSQPDLREEKKGPRVGSPEKAIEGFLKGAGLVSIDQAEKRATDKGEFYFAVIERKGGQTTDVLPGIILAAMNALPWPKSMKWGDGSFAWVRPLQGVLAIFDGKPLNGEVVLGGSMAPIVFGDRTVGHRFHAPQSFAVTSFADYREKLRKARVILDSEERKAIIKEKAAALAKAEGLTARDDIGLLEEVAGLVEWPVPYVGKIDEAFMEVPQEVLVTSMRAHQKYFACLKPDGSLAPRFIVVANTETEDGGKVVVAGNERVLRARLSDAKFFWDQDRRTKLAERVPALKNIVFHARLGTVAEKVDRIQALAADLLTYVPDADADLVRSAA